jgi:hypothetical protein
MLLKYITCEVPPDRRAGFCEAQEHWRSLASVDGFCGQIGGWGETHPNRACIFAFWNDLFAYAVFKNKLHDPIFERSRQAGTYSSSDIGLVDLNRGKELVPEFRAMLPDAGLLLYLIQNRNGPSLSDAARSMWADVSGNRSSLAIGRFYSGVHLSMAIALWNQELRSEAEIIDFIRAHTSLEHELRKIRSLYADFVRLEPNWRVMPSI